MKLFYIVILIFIVNISYSQSEIHIQGKILDINDSLGVENASILINNHHIGTITNKDGIFNLSIDSKYKNDSITISHVVYKRIKLSINELNNNTLNSIYIKEKINYLQTVFISSDSTYSLLHHAYDNTQRKIGLPIILHTYYKEIAIKNNKYELFADALLDVYIDKNKKSTHHISQSRIKKDSSLTLGLNPVQISVLTSVYGALSKKKKNETLTHTYKLKEDINSKYYIIESTPNMKDTTLGALFSGRIYIDKKSMLITRVEAEILPEHLKLVKKLTNGGHLTELTSIKQVFYYKLDSNMLYLEYSMMNIKLKKYYETHTDEYIYKSEMHSLDISDVKVKKFRRRNIFKGNYIYQSDGKYDFDFWDNNIIPKTTIKEQEFINNIK